MSAQNAALLHEKAKAYWQQSTNARLAAEDYYIRQEAGLRALLASYPRFERGLDIGCGDGGFTLIAADYCEDIEGIDVSPSLIAQACEAQKSHDNAARARFSLGDIEHVPAQEPFHLVLCMGVTSGLIDAAKFEGALDALAHVTDRSGVLITKDTLSYGEGFVSQVGDYVAIYRNHEDYFDAFSRHGFKLQKQIILTDGAPNTFNALFCFISRA
jgi:ubiquinone/menaquinone biosynthesis C-methylase UbiE